MVLGRVRLQQLRSKDRTLINLQAWHGNIWSAIALQLVARTKNVGPIRL
jgi:hypothetical protein